MSYDPNAPVCNNQDNFNVALQKGLQYVQDKNVRNNRGMIAVSVALWVIFIVWAVMLAMQVPDPNSRRVSLVFALIAGPAYVLAHYLGLSASDKGAGMSMCGVQYD